jgi:hypothetical protein
VVTAAGNVGIGTGTPAKLLDVNGEAAVRNLPAAAINDRLVFANAAGDLKSLLPGTTGQYLSGNGTWQNLPTGGGTVTGADQGVTLNGNTVLLGDYCQKGGGQFQSDREINMNNFNLYFNSEKEGKIRMGMNLTRECQPLFTRLEISSYGLNAANDYANPSLSGLRFTDLTANDAPIRNETRGVLSLDKDGDVIWVEACCNGLGKTDLTGILQRLDKLEAELNSVKKENTELKQQLSKANVTLDYKKNVLEQNTPNPFNQATTIGYSIATPFAKAAIVFTAANGDVIQSVAVTNAGKGQINVSAGLIAKGVYSYSLVIDGKVIDTKQMIKL